MKKVIDKKLYDTDTAELICEYNNGFYPSDAKCYLKKLYKSPKGQYFFYEKGGALSCMSAPFSGGKTGSTNMVLCSKDVAKKFAQRNDIDTAEKEFGKIERG